MKNDCDKDILRWTKLRMRLAEISITDAFGKLRAAQIEPILIKGWVVGKLYPENHPRAFADIDLCVNPLQYHQAKGILKNTEIGFMVVDLHEGCRHLDKVPWKNLFDNSRLVKIEETFIRILRPEDHLRVICTHWLNDGGAYKERLWDIYYAVENRPKDFEWDRCLNIAGKKRRKWIICALGLAQKYLGLDLQDTPIEKELEGIPRWVFKTVENEWESKIRLKPLQGCLQNKKELVEQIKKRFPPNPIQATIELEGEFDSTPRIFYQIGDIFYRMPLSLKNLISGAYEQYLKK
jgi:hypothetical protein